MKITFTLALILTFSSLPLISATCINSADDYAVEVVLNKPGITYDLNKLNNAENVALNNNLCILKSEYSSSIATILETKSDLTCGLVTGLSVRLQMPVKSETKTMPYLKFVSSAKGMLNISEESYNGWEISCIQGDPIPQCEFRKSKTIITASLTGKKYELTIETNENLKSCSPCDGRCITNENKCINKDLRTDIEDILTHSQLIKNFEDIMISYRIAGTGNAVITDLSSESVQEIDWKQALRQELTTLRSNNIISITNSDIDEISELAKQGSAGINSRIIFGEDTTGNEKWLYYKETKFPTLTKLQNCKEFPISLIPAGDLAFSNQTKISSYYLIPMIMAAALAVLFIFLTVIARIIETSKRKHRIKPVTSLI